MSIKTTTLASRRERLEQRSAQTDSGCIEWLGARNTKGYGLIVDQGKTSRAHRVAYEVHTGTIPEGMMIDHVCHNPPCINPQHLRAVTQKQNRENLKGPTSLSTSGVLGVSWDKRERKWRARVKHNDVIVFQKHFKDIKEAEEAVIAARNLHFTHNAADRKKTRPSRRATVTGLDHTPCTTEEGVA